MQYLLDCATLLLNAGLCFWAMHQKFELHKENRLYRILLVVLCIIVKMVVIYLRVPPLNFISTGVMIFFIIKVPYKCKYTSALLYSAIMLTLSLGADSLSILINSITENMTISNTISENSLTFQRHLFDWLLQIIFYRIFALIVRKNEYNKGKWHEIIFYIVLVVFEVAVFAYISYMVQDYTSGRFIVFMMCGFIVLDMYMMYVLHKISQTRETENKIALMQQQENLQMQMYLELQNKYNQSRSVAHDMNRHIRALQTLIKNTSEERAEQYILDLNESVSRLQPTIKNQNAMLAIVLNILSEHCEKNKIELNLEIEDFSLDFMSDIDITTIFSNVFDNAVEACSKVSQENRKIRITLKKKLGLMLLRMVNTCESVDRLQNKTVDINKIHVGIGLSNVKKTVEKYGGALDIHKADDKYEIAITIPFVID